MLSVSALLFAVAALTGLFLAVSHFRGYELNMGIALAHGAFAATGLVLLGIAVIRGGLSRVLLYSLILFVVTALGGFGLFSFHLQGKSLPSPVVVIHALAAVGSFGLLLYGLVI